MQITPSSVVTKAFKLFYGYLVLLESLIYTYLATYPVACFSHVAQNLVSLGLSHNYNIHLWPYLLTGDAPLCLNLGNQLAQLHNQHLGLSIGTSAQPTSWTVFLDLQNPWRGGGWNNSSDESSSLATVEIQ